MATMNAALSRKLQRVLEMDVDQEGVMDSMRHIGGAFYTTNDAAARRNLRSDIERHHLQINLDFLRALETVQVVCQ
jgi:hypothetical protein